MSPQGITEFVIKSRTIAPCVVYNTGAVLLLLLPGAVASCRYSFVTHTDVILCLMTPLLEAGCDHQCVFVGRQLSQIWLVYHTGEFPELSLARAVSHSCVCHRYQ